MNRHEKLRENKGCENCGHYVEKRFCPECGQENIETRQPFHYLFTVSVEDFIHYDSRFWKTILYLLFYPARLTKIYLSGKRKLYVPPVTLYIFISFITFFIPSILPEKSEEKKGKEEKIETTNINPGDNTDKDVIDRVAEQFDQEKFLERLSHDFSKAVFLYMPIFAFWLLVFHNKKKWYYFDHGIYTLHYFSFILLSSLLLILFHWVYSFFDLGKIGFIKFIHPIIMSIAILYFIYYFFHSHRIVYQETKAISRLKCIALFFINSFCMFLFLILYMFIELYITNKPLLFETVKSIN